MFFRTHRRRRNAHRTITLAVIVALIAVSGCQPSRAGRRCTGGFSRDATHVLSCQGGRWVRIGTFSDVAAALREARMPQVVLIGDSIARSLADELGAALRPRGVRYQQRTYPCGVIEGSTADATGVPWELGRNCAGAIQQTQTEIVSELKPDLVIALSSWETLDRIADGAWNPYFTPESDQRILGLYARMVDRMTTTGARVVLVTLPDHIDSTLQPLQPERTERTRHLNGLLEEVARRDPARVGVVRMDDIVCPTTPCPAIVDGVGLRTIDGIHFDGPAAATYVASRLGERILTQPLGNGRTLS